MYGRLEAIFSGSYVKLYFSPIFKFERNRSIKYGYIVTYTIVA